jgi:hypothetical protein
VEDEDIFVELFPGTRICSKQLRSWNNNIIEHKNDKIDPIKEPSSHAAEMNSQIEQIPKDEIIEPSSSPWAVEVIDQYWFQIKHRKVL